MDTSVNDVVAAYKADNRGVGHDGTSARPWVMLNMVSSIDGAIEIDGVSGALGNDADFAVFKALRSLSDVILVAAGTANAERYRVPQVSDEVAAERQARGQQRRPRIAVVTARLSLDPNSALFDDPDYRPIIATVEDAPPDKLAVLSNKADIVKAGTGELHLPAAIAAMAALVGPVILAEGGPTLNAALAQADLFDELALSVAPMLVGGDSGRLVGSGPTFAPRAFAVDRALAADGMLFTRYLRNRTPG